MPEEQEILDHMLMYLVDYIDPWNEIDMTKMAEDAAMYFYDRGYNVYLDEITYDIDELFFECAFKISEMYDKGELIDDAE